MTRCHLCLQERELRNSHIVPEFLYGKLYNDKRQLMAISGLGKHGRSLLQNGIKQHLFCEACEQHFNEKFEKPFKKWLDARPLPNPWPLIEEAYWTAADYGPFKLFHLSVLFRASVCSLGTFSHVTLGPRHEERMRQLLLTCDPGSYSEYPVFGFAVIHHETRQLVPMVSTVVKSSIEGHRCWGIMYGGVQWWVSVSSHQNHMIERAGLQPDGRMVFFAEPWHQVPIIQEAARALRSPVRIPSRG
jgi:hypothetical protein